MATVGLFAVDDEGVDMVLIRYTMYLPVKYVPLALGVYITSRQVWERI